MSPDNDSRNPRSKRTNRRAETPARVPFGEYRFCRIDLTAGDKADIREDYLPGVSPMAVLADLAALGYKFTHTVDKDGKTHLCSLTCNRADDENAGLTITARGGDLTRAIIVLGYKVLILCGDRPWRQVEHERGGSYDDIG